jgi:hypothetical protein
MKHAVLIIAHTQLDFLVEIIEKFDDNFYFFIHVDKKVNVPHYIIDMLLLTNRVRFVGQQYSVNWGGRSIVDVILWLCHTALSDNKGFSCDYFHLISGFDYPIKKCDDFKCFFEKYIGRNFLEFFRLPDLRWFGEGIDRLTFFHPMDRIDWKNPFASKIYERYVNFQRSKPCIRPLPEYPIYGGSTWWSLTHEAITYICEHANDNGWYDRLKDTFAPDEMFVQTILLNSYLKGTLVNNNLRHVNWNMRDGKSPALLDERDALEISLSSALFARKIDSNISRHLINILNNTNLK